MSDSLIRACFVCIHCEITDACEAICTHPEVSPIRECGRAEPLAYINIKPARERIGPCGWEARFLTLRGE